MDLRSTRELKQGEIMDHTQKRIQLDWNKLHGFKLVERSRDGANIKCSQAVLGAKLGGKTCIRPAPTQSR